MRGGSTCRWEWDSRIIARAGSINPDQKDPKNIGFPKVSGIETAT